MKLTPKSGTPSCRTLRIGASVKGETVRLVTGPRGEWNPRMAAEAAYSIMSESLVAREADDGPALRFWNWVRELATRPYNQNALREIGDGFPFKMRRGVRQLWSLGRLRSAIGQERETWPDFKTLRRGLRILEASGWVERLPSREHRKYRLLQVARTPRDYHRLALGILEDRATEKSLDAMQALVREHGANVYSFVARAMSGRGYPKSQPIRLADLTQSLHGH